MGLAIGLLIVVFGFWSALVMLFIGGLGFLIGWAFDMPGREPPSE